MMLEWKLIGVQVVPGCSFVELKFYCSQFSKDGGVFEMKVNIEDGPAWVARFGQTIPVNIR